MQSCPIDGDSAGSDAAILAFPSGATLSTLNTNETKTVLAAIRSILPRALVFRYSRLKQLVKDIDVPRVKNVLRYDHGKRTNYDYV